MVLEICVQGYSETGEVGEGEVAFLAPNAATIETAKRYWSFSRRDDVCFSK